MKNFANVHDVAYQTNILSPKTNKQTNKQTNATGDLNTKKEKERKMQFHFEGKALAQASS